MIIKMKNISGFKVIRTCRIPSNHAELCLTIIDCNCELGWKPKATNNPLKRNSRTFQRSEVNEIRQDQTTAIKNVFKNRFKQNFKPFLNRKIEFKYWKRQKFINFLSLFILFIQDLQPIDIYASIFEHGTKDKF